MNRRELLGLALALPALPAALEAAATTPPAEVFDLALIDEAVRRVYPPPPTCRIRYVLTGRVESALAVTETWRVVPWAA